MDYSYPDSHSFVVKVWAEECASDGTLWRGHVTHVMSGRRRYVMQLRDVLDFIETYLLELGVKPDA